MRLSALPSSWAKLLVPEGHLAIAQRFSVGIREKRAQVPKGRLIRISNGIPVVPSGLMRHNNRNPTLKRWAILIQSLRDKDSDAGLQRLSRIKSPWHWVTPARR